MGRLPAILPLFLAISAISPAVCQIVGEASHSVPVEEWLRGPDRRDFPWKISVDAPRLTFQQRYLLQVHVKISAPELQKSSPRRDLHFVVKVADEERHWFPGEDYYHYPVPPALDASDEIQFAAGLYLRPGNYVLAVMAYDSVLKNGDLVRQNVRVPALKNDPLPHLDRDLPTVEFLREVPRGSVLEPRGTLQDDTWELGSGREWLPVADARPVRIDVVLNFSQWLEPRPLSLRARMHSPVEWVAPTLSEQRQMVARMLQIGSVLSDLGVQDGCVRVTGLDIIRMKVLFDDLDGSQADWKKIGDQVNKNDRNTIDVHALAGRTRVAEFLSQKLSALMADTSGCAGVEEVRRVIVMASPGVEFPEGTRLVRLAPESDRRLYYLKVGFDVPDDIERVLRPAKPRKFAVEEPRKFRQALAQIVKELGSK